MNEYFFKLNGSNENINTINVSVKDYLLITSR